MLKNIPPILGPDLLHILRAMGHGDEIVIADANFPGTANAKRFVRLDGISATDVMDAVLTLMPVDDFVDDHAIRMQVVDDPDRIVPITEEFQAILSRHAPGTTITALERFAFYERAKTAFAIVQTGENRLYGNIILKKGIIRPEDH
jgi:L-fucose mutarotase